MSGTLVLLTLFALGFFGLLAYVIGKWCFMKDTEVENRRRAASKMGATLQSMGLVLLPELLFDYSVGDYSGMGEKIKTFVEMLNHGEAAVISEFEQVFNRVLNVKLGTAEGRALLAAKLADMIEDTDPSVTGTITAKAVAA